MPFWIFFKKRFISDQNGSNPFCRKVLHILLGTLIMETDEEELNLWRKVITPKSGNIQKPVKKSGSDEEELKHRA
jgi:hypothetical protein